MRKAFAVWLTGLPASGKSAIASALKQRLTEAGLAVEVLESDVVRLALTPAPTYKPEERELFYRALAFCGSRLVAHGVPVIFDATANLRAYRTLARTLIPHFMEIAVSCPLEVCRRRDYKGTYRLGAEGKSATVPGLQEPYEPPQVPDLELDTAALAPDEAAAKLMQALQERGFLEAARADAEK